MNGLEEGLHTLETEYGAIAYRLNRSARRSLTIHVKESPADHPSDAPCGSASAISAQEVWVEVAAPLRMPQERIRSFILLKSRWIIAKVRELREHRALFPRKHYRNGEEFLFLGRKYPLTVLPDDIRRPRVSFDEAGWLVSLPVDSTEGQMRRDIRKKLFDWYRAQARELLGGRIFHFARLLGLEPLKVSVRTQKRMWGCCHYHKRAIHLNWQLVQAPLSVIDYVIVHEFCHLKVPNHSRRFWREVGKVLPDFEDRRRWLKDNQLALSLPR